MLLIYLDYIKELLCFIFRGRCRDI